MINVTKTYLPPIDEYLSYLSKIFENHQVTNYGPLVSELEEKLKEYLGVKHLFFVSNGTIALQLSIKALDLMGEIITTPFSYVATTSSIVWEGCQPVFVDIDPRTYTIDPELIEPAITPATTAILCTHVYGYPCAVERIAKIADKHHLKIVYDAAHAFSVRYKGTSILNFGDASTLSFHATKLFHTGEGGAVVTNNDAIADRIEYMLNFGHKNTEEFRGLGINGKNSELHAGLGLSILPHVPEIITIRKQICDSYDRLLRDSGLVRPFCPQGTDYNHAYYPILFPTYELLNLSVKKLNEKEIFPRRYFYPSLNTLPYIKNLPMPISEDISRRILCLPLSNYLTENEITTIAKTLLEILST